MIRERKRTTDFNTWLQAVELEDLEVYALYQAVENLISEGLFTCSPGRDVESSVHVVTTPAIDLKLDLITEDARKAFLTHLRHEYMNGMEADVWLAIQKEKDAA